MNPEVEILSTNTPALFQAAVRRAAAVLQAGDVVALPTETVYGLAANALHAQAVLKIFAIKGRPATNPIIVHVAGLELARKCVARWPAMATQLAQKFWPGPLTLVLERAQCIPPIVTAGGATIGIRWPAHPFLQAVIEACGFPLAMPSANLANELSPTTAMHVSKALGKRLSLVVDGGPSQIGIESTVLDLTVEPPRVLRPGMVMVESLASVIGSVEGVEETSAHLPKSPGQFPRHYAPRARVEVWHWEDEGELAKRIGESGYSKVHVMSHRCVPTKLEGAKVIVIPADAHAVARALYAEMHRSDDEGAELIIVEAFPDLPEWQAIADRLKRAAVRPATAS